MDVRWTVNWSWQGLEVFLGRYWRVWGEKMERRGCCPWTCRPHGPCLDNLRIVDLFFIFTNSLPDDNRYTTFLPAPGFIESKFTNVDNALVNYINAPDFFSVYKSSGSSQLTIAD